MPHKTIVSVVVGNDEHYAVGIYSRKGNNRISLGDRFGLKGEGSSLKHRDSHYAASTPVLAVAIT